MHHRKVNRLQGCDYSEVGYYFVTICVQNMIEWFGEVRDGKIILSEYGRIAEKIWLEIPKYYKYVGLDEFIVMPNHIHGMIIINDYDVGTEQCSVPTKRKYGLLSKVVKSFKEVFVKTIRRQYNIPDFQWQRSFYDHIIRNEESLHEIRNYIRYNSSKWEYDRENAGGKPNIITPPVGTEHCSVPTGLTGEKIA